MGRLIKKTGGFSVVELIMVLALLGIVLGLGYMFFSFGSNTFARGERRSIAQQSIRRAADFITSEIRYADVLELNPNLSVKETGWHYIYQQGGSVIYRDAGGSEEIILDSTLDKMAYSISFEEESTKELIDFVLILVFTLAAEDDLFSLDTSVHIINLVKQENYLDASGSGGPAPAVRYKKPWEY